MQSNTHFDSQTLTNGNSLEQYLIHIKLCKSHKYNNFINNNNDKKYVYMYNMYKLHQFNIKSESNNTEKGEVLY